MDDILKSISARSPRAGPRSTLEAKAAWLSVSRKSSGVICQADLGLGSPGAAHEVAAQREDSLITAWRTVSEIESILGSEYRLAEEEQRGARPGGLDDDAIQALSSQVEAALHVSLSFKDRIESSSRVFRWTKSLQRSSSRRTTEEFSLAGAHERGVPATQLATPKLLQPNTSAHSSSEAAAQDASSSASSGGDGGGGGSSQPSPPPLAAPAAPAAPALRRPPGLCLQLPGAAAVTPASAAAPAPAGKKPAVALQLQVGSCLEQGDWSTNGVWKPAAQHQDIIPPHLQQIHADDLAKVKELGRGCFGSVWLAKWRGVEVAIKEMLQSGAEASPEEVYSEAEKLASLRHPCVVAFYGIVVQPGSYATVLEYVRSGSLRSGLARIKKQGLQALPNLEPRRLRANIALQAARGMEYLHQQCMVHFDLKCDNLLCDLRDLLRPVVKIGDLGLSKRKQQTFISGNMRGTLPWMAPELFPSVSGMTSKASSCHDDKVNEKVDVFSFGVVLWEIWTLGEQPYPALSLQEIFAGVMAGNLRPAVPEGCEPEWAQLMQDCWQGKPRQRPTFGEVAGRLEALVQQWSTA